MSIKTKELHSTKWKAKELNLQREVAKVEGELYIRPY